MHFTSLKELRWSSCLFLIFANFVPQSVFAEEGTLDLEIIGLQNDNGELIVNVYQNKEGFPTKPEKAKIVIGNLNPDKEYAVAICHDANNNKTCDVNFLGVPKEEVASSNNAKSFLDPPSFEDAKFIPAKTARMTITLGD